MTGTPVALVTGGAIRLGAAVVERFAREGHDVVIHCHRSTADAEALASRLPLEYGVRAHVLQADLSRDADTVIDRANTLAGRIHTLVNSASIFSGEAEGRYDPVALDANIAVNLKAPLTLAQAFVDQACQGASVVNILDQCVLRPNPWNFNYTLSKAALHMATKTMALVAASRGVRINAVAPGLALVNEDQDAEDYERCIQSLPLRRGGSPEEVAAATFFLASMPSITGLCVTVDGGQHLSGDTPGTMPTRAALAG